MGFYIIEINDKYKQVVLLSADGELYCTDVAGLMPYTEPELEQVRKEAYDKGYMAAYVKSHMETRGSYQQGLADAWDAARWIVKSNAGVNFEVFGKHFISEILQEISASEVIEKIRQYEQEQKEQESITAKKVMRQYLDTFCKGRNCGGCPLHTPDFTCGRGRHFLTNNPVSDEEVRRAYAAVLAKMKEGES